MIAVFRIKRYSSEDVRAFIHLMTENGYKVSFEKGDRMATKVTVTKECQEYIAGEEGGDF